MESNRKVPLSEAAELCGGGTPSRLRSEFFGGGIPWVTPSDLPPIGIVKELGATAETLTEKGLEESSARLLPAGTVLFSSRATIGKIAVADKPFTTNQGFINLVPKRDVLDKWYLAFFLQHALTDIERLCGETTFKEVPRGKMRGFEIPLPRISEQRRVVGRVKACVHRVEEMQRLRDDALAETPLVEERFLAELENTFKGCFVPLRDLLAETQNGKSLQNRETAHNGRALTLSALRTHRLDMSASKPVQINVERDDKYLMRPGDVLISRSNTRELVALSAIAPDHIDEPTIFSDLLIRLTPKPTTIRPLYLTIALRMPGVRHQLRANAVGSSQTMVKISGERLRTIEVPCPSPAEQERIEAKYTAVTLATSAISEEVDGQTQDLNALRESILREAFAGNL
jgi:type I restriction enzyme S subunit